MFNEIEVLETESEALKNFNVEFPKESASASKRAAKMAAKLLDDIDSDNVTFVTSQKRDDDDDIFDFVPNDFGVGLTKGLDFYNLDKQNPEWIGVPIILATDEDMLFSNFFMGGEQNESLRNYRKNKKEQAEFDEDDEDDED
jgi:hypothetical protein